MKDTEEKETERSHEIVTHLLRTRIWKKEKTAVTALPPSPNFDKPSSVPSAAAKSRIARR